MDNRYSRKRRLLAALVAAVLVLALALSGCRNNSDGGQDAGESSAPPAGESGIETRTGGPNANEDGSTNLDTVAYYDPDFDYTDGGSIKPFKVKYLVNSSGPLYESQDVGFKHWAPLMNMQYDGISAANGDSDLYIQMLQEAIDQGYDGLLLDPDTVIYPRILEVMAENPHVQFMGCMSPIRDLGAEPDENGAYPLLWPSVGFDFYQNGVMSTEKLVEWKKENLPDVDWNDIAFLSYDFSIAPPLHLRTVGAEATWKELTGTSDNIFTVDTASGQLDMNTAQELAMTTISTNSEYKYWLVSALIDDFAQGAAVALDSQGLTDNSCVVAIGGVAAVAQWDANQHDAWRYALFTGVNIVQEPIIGALYAFMAGYATPYNIWPQWVNENDHGLGDNRFASMLLPTIWIEADGYTKYLEWTDVYAEANVYDYPADGITRDMFTAKTPVPEAYKKQ
ncbi:MAG: hypothetical protein LBD12_05575 [Clostridiales Family XIII bacterium]|jgi:ABC-type sugar transport system substrate-binding protein|nr:hypothetical protein [Clostridiales Family XIII bacterium]